MQSGFFISGVAGQMAQTRLDVISNNLANVNTAGFRADHAAFSTIFTHRQHQGAPAASAGAYLSLNRQYIDMKPGNIRQTGRPLDFAIQGDGWFKVRVDDGGIALTRAGSFRVDADGNLLTKSGLPVLDATDAPVILPPGEITATANGALYVNGEPAAELAIVQMRDPSAARKSAGTLIRTDPANIEPADASISLRQGALEDSNVNAVLMMAEMIDTMRSYQAMMKVVEQYNQIAGQINDRVGTLRG
ncbi:MAG: flagellar hook basal-body protein [Mariprofundaceae bacterium]